MADMACFNCFSPLEVDGAVRRDETCPSCRAYVRVCYNCSFYDSDAAHECAEPAAERVVHKDRANHCDFFRPGGGRGKGTGDARNKSLDEVKKLFKNF